MSIFGIDFGTTNSAAVKLIEHGDPQKYGDEAGAPFPSIVAIDRATGEAIAGRCPGTALHARGLASCPERGRLGAKVAHSWPTETNTYRSRRCGGAGARRRKPLAAILDKFGGSHDFI